jgi:hypothetical protein
MGCGSRSKPNCFQIRGKGHLNALSVNCGMVRKKSPKQSELSGMLTGCSAGQSVDQNDALIFAV